MFYITRDTHNSSHTQRESIEAHECRSEAYRALSEHAVTLQRHGFNVSWWTGEPSFVAVAPSGNSVAMYVSEGN